MAHKTICPFFGKCGGCLYQDLTDETYCAKKVSFIMRAFRDYGIEAYLNPIISVPIESRRRATFAFAGGHVGYHALKSHQIVEISECRLLCPEIVSFLPKFKKWVQKLGGAGDITVLSTNWGLDIHIKSKDKNLGLARLELLTEFGQDNGVARLIFNTQPIMEKVKLTTKPDDFLQPSVAGEKILQDLVQKEVGTANRAIDLFCGGGTFTTTLVKMGVDIRGYDCADNVLLLGKRGVQRDLFRHPLMPDELSDLDLIILDPPRAGAKAQIEQIAHSQVPKIVMVSCSPQTAARDSKILIDAGWHLKSITPVDQFKWSNHIELVIVFER